MSKTVQAILLGGGVALVVAFGLSFLFAVVGAPSGGLPVLLGVLMGVFTAYIFGNLAGNRKIANASASDQAAALNRAPPPGKALVYLYREGFVAKLAGLNLAIDGKPVGQIKSPAFTCIVVSPGAHNVSAAFGGLAGAQSRGEDCRIDVDAGQGVAVRMAIKMGMVQGSVDMTVESDMAAVRGKLAKMPMTPPDVAEVV
jgi:hypothetical protein